MTWKGTVSELPTLKRYHVKGGSKKSNPDHQIKTAIIFDHEWGPIVDIPTFNKQDGATQATLIVHESLRRGQIDYGLDLNEEELQKLTAQIMSSDPTPGEDLLASLGSKSKFDPLRSLQEQRKFLSKLGESILYLDDNDLLPKHEIDEGLCPKLRMLSELKPDSKGCNALSQNLLRTMNALSHAKNIPEKHRTELKMLVDQSLTAISNSYASGFDDRAAKVYEKVDFERKIYPPKTEWNEFLKQVEESQK